MSEAHKALAVLGCLLGLTTAWGLLWLGTPSARAAIAAPSTIDGPSSDIVGLGGVAMAPDGTGGLVYTKSIEGIPHIFVSRYAAGRWGPPIRVDWDKPYAASQPAIAAGPGGTLMVVWVTGFGTLVNGTIRDGLYSATLGPGTAEFSPSLLVDPNVGTGAGVDPSIAGTQPGKAIVAYRAVTQTFGVPGDLTTVSQLHPGDVLAEVRVARMESDRWSRVGAVNRNLAASMRPPNETNAPKVAIGASGRAVVAWQEPDQTGAARVLMRRVDGSAFGPVIIASPETLEGKPVDGEASAFAVAMTGQDRARVAVLVEPGQSAPSVGQVFVTTLGSGSSLRGAEAVGPVPVEPPGPPAKVGPPAVAAADGEGAEGSMLLAWAAGSATRVVGLGQKGELSAPTSPPGPAADPGSPMVATVGQEGEGTVAYETEASGAPGVAVRQELVGGGSQSAVVFGPLGGPISGLVGAGVETGDALIAFAQGENGKLAIVGDRISAPPERFPVVVPEGWVRPGRAKVSWSAPETAVGGLTYSLLIDGRAVRSGLSQRQMTPKRTQLKSGVNQIQVEATDQLGAALVSNPVKLRVDNQPPRLRARIQRSKGNLLLKVEDDESGVRTGSVHLSFGDGDQMRGRARVHHHYARPGDYLVTVRASDRDRNRLLEHLRVAVG